MSETTAYYTPYEHNDMNTGNYYYSDKETWWTLFALNVAVIIVSILMCPWAFGCQHCCKRAFG